MPVYQETSVQQGEDRGFGQQGTYKVLVNIFRNSILRKAHVFFSQSPGETTSELMQTHIYIYIYTYIYSSYEIL